MFEPKIVGFFCNWCTYLAADLAGSARITYAPNVRVVRVMCSGRVDPQMVLYAFAQGADGVLIGGCHPGDCHYAEGNYKTLRRAMLLKRMLPALGIEEERFRVEWISGSEAQKLVSITNEFVATLKELGPRVAQRKPTTLMPGKHLSDQVQTDVTGQAQDDATGQAKTGVAQQVKTDVTGQVLTDVAKQVKTEVTDEVQTDVTKQVLTDVAELSLADMPDEDVSTLDDAPTKITAPPTIITKA
jgi:F420-non-reducing hydrogenase iron-sulfur subunit